MEIPVAEITTDETTQDAIKVECRNHNGCEVKIEDGKFYFPVCCTKDCRDRTTRQMKWAFGD